MRNGLPAEPPAEAVDLRAGMKLLRPRIFEQLEGTVCAMSTRVIDVAASPFGMNVSYRVGDDPEHVRECRARFFGELGIREEDVARPGQVHSARVLETVAGGRYPGCDAVITNRPGVFLSVTVADCVPILMADPVHGAVAAVHAGWRGSRDRILEGALDMLVSVYGSDPNDIIAYIGPSAGVCCYEVGKEVAGGFPSSAVRLTREGKYHLDLKGCNRDILLGRGVRPDHIALSTFCTICNPELFHSYRRERERSGRMLALIGIRA